MSLRIALLSYRSKPHCGGQGVYVRHLSRELVALGHDVEVFSGQPYPDLDEGVRLTKVPSLDLYREPDPFRVPRLREFRDLVDVEEFLTMCVAGFPEPKTFGKRIGRVLADRVGDFDVVHDNQVLAHGILDVEALGLPVVTTIHHPITVDRRLDLAAADDWKRRLTLRRWYGFLRMQAKVARRARSILTASAASKRDIVSDFGVDPARIRVIPLGVDDGFRPPTAPRVPGRIVAMASADMPIKGIANLLEAFAKLRTERDHLELLLVTKPLPGGRTERIVDRLAIAEHVHFVHGITDAELVEVMGSAEVACVPSLYEGFSLPTAELMACATPLVVSDAGAIPEVVGPDGLCADIVPPGDVDALTRALAGLVDDPERRERYGAAGRARVDELFSWRAVAAATATAYQDSIDAHR
jgi:glycosyltransferase involved in cell wall biosynthesis